MASQTQVVILLGLANDRLIHKPISLIVTITNGAVNFASHTTTTIGLSIKKMQLEHKEKY
ncbi:hypothetical protein EBZ38_14080 [bacterium]|nr:hypothetical protein [bacterium]